MKVRGVWAVAFGMLLYGVLGCGGRVAAADGPWVVYDGFEGPGEGKHVVLVTGDEEYRSEEGMTQLGKILAKRHGFKCTVLFAIDPETGGVNPDVNSNIPGLEVLDDADLMVLFIRWRDLPAEQMKRFEDYFASGKPVIALRTGTHPFNVGRDHPYARYSWNSRVPGWEGGVGRQIVGETWVSHYGEHGKEGTRGLIAAGAEGHPILRGIEDGDLFSGTDVYEVRLPFQDSKNLVMGQTTAGMTPGAPPVEGPKNNPMMPIAWVKSYQVDGGERGKVFATTMGTSEDFEREGMRRMMVNAVYWGLGMEGGIDAGMDVGLVGEFKPTRFGFGGAKKGTMPSDYEMTAAERAGE